MSQSSDRSPKNYDNFSRSIFRNDFWNIQSEYNLASIVLINWNLEFCMQFARAYVTFAERLTTWGLELKATVSLRWP